VTENGTDQLVALPPIKSRKINRVGQLFLLFHAIRVLKMAVSIVNVVLGGYTLTVLASLMMNLKFWEDALRSFANHACRPQVTLSLVNSRQTN